MSHAHGAVKFKDGTIKRYEYDGTADVVISHMYDTCEEVSNNWRNHEWLYCTCGCEEDVEIYTDYGYGSIFNGKACKKCMSVTGDVDDEIWEANSLEDKTKPEWCKQIWNTIIKD